jgi:predicted GH43/DUF377 family glycosyl hydrolase
MKRFIILAGMMASSLYCAYGARLAPAEHRNNNGGSGANPLPEWAMGGFVRPEGANPVISPNPESGFFCPMRKTMVGWEESDTFNPAAVVKDGRICVLYRAEDNSGVGIGRRTSRIGLAETADGIRMTLRDAPVMYPDEDNMKACEWEGGCEDPRVAVTDDGRYVMAYTSWNRSVFRLCIATSTDLVHWTKHGPAFAKAYDGRFRDFKCKSGSIVTKVVDGRQIIAKVGGKYLMYWGENYINLAVSDNLTDWRPGLDSDGNIKKLVVPRQGYFDSQLTECGPPAVMTDRGILLLYNGKNRSGDAGDRRFAANTYAAGQLLFALHDPEKVTGRLDAPFFRPMESFEKSGQYRDGTVFIEGLTLLDGKWYLYYGCADSRVGVAIYDPSVKTPGDPTE